MKINIINASNDDIDYLKKAKLFNIFAFAHNLPKDEILKINIMLIIVFQKKLMSIK